MFSSRPCAPGPNELSIIEKEAVVPVLGTQGMPRGPMWDGRRFRQAGNTKPYDSLIDVRDNKIHHALRKDWNTAFSAGAVQDYLQLLEARLRQFRDALQNDMAASKDSGAHCVDLRKWITHFATDVMGDLAYGGCFELMREGDVEGFRAVLDEGLVLPSIMQHIPWIAPMILSIPFVASKMRVFAAYGIKYSTLRKATPPKKKDLFYHLYEGSGERTTTRTEAELMRIIVSDSLLTLVAGSDTTATTLCAVLCFILSDRRVYEKLRAELDDAFPEGTGDDGRPEIVFDRLPRLAYLNAVINEGLRLVPAVPTNIQRAPEAGSGGKILGDTQIFVSEGTAVIIPTFTLHRDPRYFSPQPNHFIPERWLSNQATKDGTVYVTDREAFIPFSYGPANCAGKVFAMAELRCVIAMLVRSFDMHHLVGPGSDDPAVLEEKARLWMNGLKDRLVFERPGFRVYMAVRKSVN